MGVVTSVVILSHKQTSYQLQVPVWTRVLVEGSNCIIPMYNFFVLVLSTQVSIPRVN
jgi:hypothetical protein